MNLSTSPVDINRREAEVSKYAADKVYEIPANVSSPTPTAYAAVVQLCSACHRRRMAGCRGSMSACRKEIQLSKKYERALKLHFRMDGKVCYDNRVGVHTWNAVIFGHIMNWGSFHGFMEDSKFGNKIESLLRTNWRGWIYREHFQIGSIREEICACDIVASRIPRWWTHSQLIIFWF